MMTKKTNTKKKAADSSKKGLDLTLKPTKDKAGRWRIGGKFAPGQVGNYKLDRRGVWYDVRTGHKVKASVVASSYETGRNDRINTMFWNKLKNERRGDRAAFLNWTKGAWTGRNRVPVEQRTQAILNSTKAANLEEAFNMFLNESTAGRLWGAVRYIDENALRNEFSFITSDMNAYIESLRKMTDEELYDEADRQRDIYLGLI